MKASFAKALLLLATALMSLFASEPQTTVSWSEVDKLVADQKFAEALDRVEQIRARAEKARDQADWTRALIREVQLGIALHQYETVVREFKEHAWPAAFPQRAALNLFYAQALVTYYQSYSWDVNQREKVESSGVVDLKLWTRDQIYAQARKAYQDLFDQRAALGKEPVTVLSEYIQPNNYPSGIRSTLRDAVCYLYVDLLADTSFWRPEESNEIYRLNLKELLEEPTKPASTIDADSHPIVQIRAILGDLEAWHVANERPEAALEAHLEMLRHFHASFTRPGDRSLISAALQKLLPRYRDYPWWAMGMATLAEFAEEEQQPGHLVQAHEFAQEGLKGYPSSVGGRLCRSIIDRIEAPDFQMTSMAIDGLNKRSVEVTHKNLAVLYFRAYPVDLERRLEQAQTYNLLLEPKDLRSLLKTGKPVAEWQVSLPATPDYETHRTFVTPPLKSRGTYAIFASAKRGFPETGSNRILSVQLVVSDIVLTARWESESTIALRAASGENDEALPGVAISMYAYNYQSGHRKVADLVSQEDGWARFTFSPGNRQISYFYAARRGSDFALLTGYAPGYSPQTRETATATLIYTDRSIYRPLQKIFWKALLYERTSPAGSFRTIPSNPVTVSLMDPNGQKVDSTTVTTNSFGTAAGEFVIPAGRVLGGWRIVSSLNGGSPIRVEEYKRPTFEVTIKEPASPLRLNRPATLKGEVKYYFGLPVTSGSVRWILTRTPVYPFWWGSYEARPIYTSGSQIVASGAAKPGQDGSFTVSFTPEADEREAKESKNISYRYRLTADVTDEGGETRSASLGFRLGFVSVEAHMNAEEGFFREGVPGAFNIRRTDLNNTPRPGKGSWRVVSLKQPVSAVMPADLPPMQLGGRQESRYQTPGDRLRPRWNSGYSWQAVLKSWADTGEQARGNLVHDDSGEARLGLPQLPAGPYRLYYDTVDDFGATYQTSQEFIVAGRKTPLALPAVLVAEKSSEEPGKTARFFAFSGLPEQPLYFETWRDGRLADRKRLVSGRDSALVEIPVKDDDRGGFSVRLTTLKDYQFIELSNSVFVPWDNKKLEVELSTFRDKIRPGAAETWRVTVKSPSGRPVEAGAAEVLAYMYDKSLDFFSPHNPPDPLSLYPTRTRMLALNTNLGQSWGMYLVNDLFRPQAVPELQGDRVKFYEGYGIGGPGRRGGIGAGRGSGVGIAGRVGTEAVTVSANGQALAEPPARPAASAKMATDRFEAVSREPAQMAVTAAAEAPPEMRSNFAETAFWQPHLLTDSQGSATIEFKVPDSVTAWNVWVHAVTRDLLSGSVHKETRSFKDLMVRPYLPRFLRENDAAEIKVVANNASDHELKGDIEIEIFDPESNNSLLDRFGISAGNARRSFTAAPGAGASVTFPVKVPPKVGPIAFRVTAAAGGVSDGELRTLPVLPGRVHLSQSRFVALKDSERREMVFDELKKSDDPTRINEQMVVTLDAQLFYSVLSALPYLINFPYECTEQTLNRFVSTGILASLYGNYPEIAKMAADLSKRPTPLEAWGSADPNRKMELEETPWLVESRGGKEPDAGMANVLNPNITKAERDSALAKLRKAQTLNGGFPWWPGGPPSPYMTLYIMYGFAKASEFGVDVPRDMVQRGWNYLAQQVRADYLDRMLKQDCCWEFLTFLNYVATCYPDPSWMGEALTAKERQTILDFCFKHWKQHSPYLKCQLALTLKRLGRPGDASLVFASVMDSAKTTRDEGTFWTPEDRSWLWYNDTIETQAFALRAMMELSPQDSRKDGLVQWLFLNKKLNHWKSTRATAEVLYSLAHYLKKEGALGVREDATVRIDGETVQYVFEPGSYTGRKNQTVIPGDKIGPGSGDVVVEKAGKGIMFASSTWSFSTDRLPEKEQGDLLSVSRSYFKRESSSGGFALVPLAEGASIGVGDEVEVHLSVRARHPCEYLHLRDPRAAGTEPESTTSRYRWDMGIGWYEEIRDSGTNFFFENLPQGEYTLKYRLRANIAGVFRVGPATLQSMYAPEFNAYSTGAVLTIH